VHRPGALTRSSAAAKLCAGEILLLRRITTCVVLTALFGLYGVPLASAFSRNAVDCCAAEMCPRPGRSLAHHQVVAHQQSHQEMVDCGMGAQSGSLRKCEIGACETQKDTVVNVGLFVLYAPMRVVRSSVQVPVLVAAPQAERALSQIPETPPPRTSLS
jgi:hypothetical protein